MKLQHQEIRQKILDSLQLSHLKKDEQDKIMTILMEAVSFKMGVVVQQSLSDQEQKELEKISQSGSDQAFAYLNGKIAGFPQIVEDATHQVVTSFRQKRNEATAARL